MANGKGCCIVGRAVASAISTRTRALIQSLAIIYCSQLQVNIKIKVYTREWDRPFKKWRIEKELPIALNFNNKKIISKTWSRISMIIDFMLINVWSKPNWFRLQMAALEINLKFWIGTITVKQLLLGRGGQVNITEVHSPLKCCLKRMKKRPGLAI